MDKETASAKYKDLAKRAIQNARMQLSFCFKFLTPAIFRLKFWSGENKETQLGTDGEYLYGDAKYVLGMFKEKGMNALARAVLHSTLHCLFIHQWVGGVNKDLWNLCCDIAVEAQILSIIPDDFNLPGDTRKSEVIKNLASEVAALTAERLYYRWAPSPPDNLEELMQLFKVDEHPWYPGDESINPGSASKGDGGSGEEGEEGSAITVLTPLSKEAEEELKKAWSRIGKSIETEIEAFSKQQGTGAGSLSKALKDVHREKYNYASFLRNFATRKEVMKLNMDEFDYIQYAYGMELYKDMPIIEPLEYRDDKVVNDLAIVIDTSGSTYSDLVNIFLTKTYNILCQEEAFDRHFNLHIIQADAVVQEDTVITSLDEFEAAIKDFKIKGGGGTDFRPAFSYVERLQKEGAFKHLKGLIYLTDGYGEYPTEKPSFESAFVFVEKTDVTVPAWAIKLVLDQKDIEQLAN